MITLASVLMDTSPFPSPSPVSEICKSDAICNWVNQTTKISWLAETSLFVIKPIRIILIVVLALIARYLINRMINRMTSGAAEGRVPTMLRPLREKLPGTAVPATTVFPERRRQRAEAIGSVLRSFVTVLVSTIAGLLILGEFGVDLTPLIAGLGIFGAALGFGAQSLVKDLIAGLFMLLEDQYGVGDSVDVGEASGIVEAVGLRTVTVRDSRGVLWYVRNGEIVRVGNRSQGWSVVIVDIPIGFKNVDDAVTLLRAAADRYAADPEFHDDFLEPPQVVGVEEITVDGAVVRATVRTHSDAQARVARELRRRLAEALAGTDIMPQRGAALRYSTPAQATEDDIA